MRGPEQFIELGDVRLRLRVEGVGRPLLLLHGWALDGAMWRPQFAALAHRHQLIAIDRRGFGRSSGEPDLAREVNDVVEVLDVLGIERAAILGMSQAARVVLRFAQKFSGRVDRMILDGPPADAEVPIAQYRDLVRDEGMHAFRREWLRHPFTHLHGGDPQMQSLLAEIVARYPGRDLQRRIATLPTVARELEAIDAPTLIVNGALDSPARLAAGNELAQRLPRARREVIPGAGHLPNLDNPAAYNECVLDFMRNHSPAPLARIA